MKVVQTGGVKVGELVKKIQMNETKVGKVWRSVTVGQEEYLKPEQDAMLAEAGEEDGFIKCFDDITGKEQPWQAVKRAREKELKYLRELGVYEKVHERAAVAKYNVTPVDSKWVDTDKTFEGEPMQIRSRSVAREFKSGDRPDLHAETHPLEALNAIISIAASHSPEFSLMHVDVSRAYFHAKAQRPVLVTLRAEDCSGKDKGKIGLLKKSMYGTRDAASNWERHWQGHLANWGYELVRSSRNPFHNKDKENFGIDAWRRLCGDRIAGKSVGAQEAAGERVSNQSERHQGSFGKEHQGAESEIMLGRDRGIVSTRSSTR